MRRHQGLTCCGVAAALSLGPTVTIAQSAGDTGWTATALVEAREVTSLAISPDGHWVLFTTHQRLMTQRADSVATWLVPWAGGTPVPVPDAFASGRWDTDASRLVVSRQDSSGMHRVLVALPDFATQPLPTLPTPSGATNVTVSPDGRRVAYCVTAIDTMQPILPDTAARHGFEADSNFSPYAALSHAGLPVRSVPLHVHPAPVCFLADVASGGRHAPQRIRLPAGVRIVWLEQWMPDSRSVLAIGADGDFLGSSAFGFNYVGSLDRPSTRARHQLYAVDASTGEARPLAGTAAEAGLGALRLSPRTGHVALLRYDTTAEDVVAAEASLSTFVRLWRTPSDTDERIIGLAGWTADERTVLAVTEDRGSWLAKRRIMMVDARTGTARELFGDELRDYSTLAVARDGRHAVAVGLRPGDPPQIYATDVSIAHPTPRVLVSREWLNPVLAVAGRIGYDTLTWTTRDGKYRVAAHVMLPPGFDANDRHRRYPLLVFKMGGPDPAFMMEWRGFVQDPLPLFAGRGYVVLSVNDRSADRRINARDRAGYLAPGCADILAGVSAALARYPIDSTRMGIIGFSFGGIMTSYVISHSDRFRAASIGEGTMNGPEWLVELYATQSPEMLVWGSQLGMVGPAGDPWSRIDRALADANTPMDAANHVTTPNLVETGVYPITDFAEGAWPWSQEMRRLGVPESWWLYPRSGHGWATEPWLLVDSYERNLAWFDYWLKDLPYQDSLEQRRYDAWKRRRAAMGDPRWAGN